MPRQHAVKKRAPSYVDFLMDEWRMREYSGRVQGCVGLVLRELSGEALLALRDPKLEIIVMPEADFSVWAYFPIHRRRTIAQRLRPKPATQVLLVLSETHFVKQALTRSKDELRDHFGHALLYLRNPKARNECADAEREWRALNRMAAPEFAFRER